MPTHTTFVWTESDEVCKSSFLETGHLLHTPFIGEAIGWWDLNVFVPTFMSPSYVWNPFESSRSQGQWPLVKVESLMTQVLNFEILHRIEMGEFPWIRDVETTRCPSGSPTIIFGLLMIG